MPIEEANVTQLARLMNVSRQAVYKAERDGRIQRNQNGKFDVEQTLWDWEAHTHPGHGGKREPLFRRQANQQVPEDENNIFVQYWLDITEESFPLLALILGRQGGMAPKEIWSFLAEAVLIQWHVVFQLLKLPDEQPIKLEGLMYKLGGPAYSQELESWLLHELEKGDDEPLDPSIWD